MNKIAKWATIAAASLPLLTLASHSPIRHGAETAPVRSFGDILNLMEKLIVWFQAILFILAVIFILYAAFLFLTSAGDAEKVKTARTVLVYAAVGIGIILLAGAVEFLVRDYLGAP